MCNVSAQFNNAYDYKFKTYTTQDGLVHNYTKKCVEDSKGFLWIITQHGLSRFDGLYFKNFEHVYNDSTSLPENDLSDIAIDKQDRIWLSYNKGLCFYNQAEHAFHIIRQNNKPLQSSAVAYDSISNSMCSVNYNGYTTINCNNFSATAYLFNHKLTAHYYNIDKIFIDSKRRLWITCPRLGYYTINLTTNNQFYYDKDIWPIDVFEDAAHRIWMTTWDNGLHNINVTATQHIHSVYSNEIHNVNEPNILAQIQFGITQSKALGGDSILWVANETTGVQLFNINQKKFVYIFNYNPQIKYGIATDFNYNIYSDKMGVIWICTWHGITKVNKQEQQFSSGEIPFLKSNFYNRLSGIIDDPYKKNITWLTAEGSGIFRIDKITGKVLKKYYFDLGKQKTPDDDMNFNWRWTELAYEDEDKNIWIPVVGLIKISNGEPRKISLQYNNQYVSVYNIAETGKHTLWLATKFGIGCYNKENNAYQNFSLFTTDEDANRLNDIKKINDSLLAVAGRHGAYLFNINTKKITTLHWNFTYLDSAAQHSCYSIETIKNYLFVGTDAGLVCYNLQTNTSTVIGYKENISPVFFRCLKKDADNNLWIYSSGGLYKYNITTNAFQKFTTTDGIYDLSNDAIGFFEYNHLFYIGYRMAYTSFNPLKVNINPVQSIPVITDITVNNTLMNVAADSFATNALQLSHKQNSIVINYTSADFTNTDKITFAYRLQGYDTNWVRVGRKRNATFTNLKSGSYIFKVRACNSSGLWNETPVTFAFYIATPFWQTWWFYAILILLFCFIVYSIYRYRINRITVIYKVRDHISKNLHDEIGATLSSINIYSELAQQKLDENNEVNKMLQRIHEGSAQVMESMSDIVWYVNPKNDAAENVIIKMREYAAPLLEARHCNLSFVVHDDLTKVKLNMQQRQHYYLIFKEAINNIVKYACAKNVSVTIGLKEHHINLAVKDDGKGFNTQNSKRGNGLLNMQQRAQLLQGELQVTSIENEGTLIELNFPVSL